MKLTIELPFDEEELKSALEQAQKGKAEPLRSLCQKEVEHFEAVIRQHPQYSDGLVVIERRAVEGYIYQKLRNHITYDKAPSGLPQVPVKPNTK